MSKLLDFLGGGVVKQVGDVLDNLTTSKEEKLEAQRKIQEVLMQAESQAQEQVTRRWEADMKSDNWLSKNIRPVICLFLTFIFVILSIFHGNVGNFSIDESYIPIYQTLLITVYGAYFAGRSIEKIKKEMIQQYDREGNLIDEFSSGFEAAQALGIDKSNIYKCLKGLRNYAGGYKWVENNSNINTTEEVGEVTAAMMPELDLHLKERGIDKKDVQSVKHWQSGSGEYRFSIVTKEDKGNLTEFKKKFFEEMKEYIPQAIDPVYNFKVGSLVAYEISLPDFHYGKIGTISQAQANRDFLNTIKELHRKAEGLNIEKFILPIGNDGLNSEGFSRATTKGTPQHDAEEWQQTFRGYWKLLVVAIDYLSAFAPVDVIVVQGNHDFERMFYIGEVIESWYKDYSAVTVDNSYESRKYYRYGKNMLMFTHGDKEKTADMPLLMATEQPLMFAACPNREVHCGHLHREIVNTYQGVKVRFLPSICTNDAWHKSKGYSAPREAQAYIWNKEKGCEGYLQVNLK